MFSLMASHTHTHTQSYHAAGPPQAGGPGGLSGHMTLQQEVDVEFRKQQQDVGQHADDSQW